MSGTMYPALRYRNAAAAIDWLCRAFGFEPHAVHKTPDGDIAHAELKLGDGYVMLGSARDDALRLKPAGELGASSVCIYVWVQDADAHYATAKATGAEIVVDLYDTPYDSREYARRDPEGQLWSFGTYRPAERA